MKQVHQGLGWNLNDATIMVHRMNLGTLTTGTYCIYIGTYVDVGAHVPQEKPMVNSSCVSTV